MTIREINPDTQTILLLCGSLGKPRANETPLSASEYHKLAQWLYANSMRPSNLLQPDNLSRLSEAQDAPIAAERLARLLARGAALALAMESWSNKGLWVLSRSDPEYPQQVKSRLSRSAPPVLYGVGDWTLLAKGGLAVVGSRDVDEAALAFTQRVATACGTQGIPVVSGAARGVDSEAMHAALAAGGTVIGVLADSLVKAAVAGKYREALRASRLALVTAYEPEVGFSVRNAMGRNKYIYTLSDYALVVSTSLGQGGTWSGATENLDKQWVPLFVRLDDTVPQGNRRLLELGAIPLEEHTLNEHGSLRDSLAHLVATHNGLAFKEPLSEALDDNVRLPEPHEESGDTDAQAPAVSDSMALSTLPMPDQTIAHLEQPQTADAPQSNDLFEVIWPYFERELHIARTERELAELFHIEVTQARSWLHRALEEGKATRLIRPVRYIAVSQQQQVITMPLL